ncbi:unnamed protein product [Ectocarpus sp. CCAP 1310/34]|nr:unnamed protein product [Ectocarpus sp. CCAP 1310/34]
MNEGLNGGDPADDFELFWGMPRSGGGDGGSSGSGNNHESRGGGGLTDVTGGGAGLMSSPTLRGSSSRAGNLNTATPTLMGNLWSHSSMPPEAYGHSLHVHASQAEGPAPTAAGLNADLHGGSPPPPASSRRPVWLPPPNQHHQHSAGRGDGMHVSSRQCQQHLPATSPPRQPARPTAVTDARGRGRNGGETGVSGSIVEYKLEELAAVITASVVGKLEVDVREALWAGNQQQQHLPVPPPPPTAAAAVPSHEDDQRRVAAAVEATVAPLRSRLAALEVEITRLSAASRSGSGGSGDGGRDTPKGVRGKSSGSGGGVKGGVSGNAAAEPIAALTALAQRTGTLEGRHKQLQAKVALLDNYFGPKASDWAQTIKAFLQERVSEPAAGVARRAAVTVGTRGKGGKRGLGIDAPAFVPQSAAQRSTAAVCASASSGPGQGAARAPPPAPAPSVDVEGAKHEESAPEVVGAAQGDSTAAAESTAAKGAATSTATAAAVGKLHHCAGCAETQESCSRLEKRVAESERALSSLQSQAAAAATEATAALESRRTAAAAATAAVEKAASLYQKAAATAAAGGGGNWASKTSVEKLAAALRQLAARTKDGEDALALVDHGLRGVREEMAPLSRSVLTLKRLVESQLREKDQAAELLKGYVTTITREVAAISRQHIAGLVGPGRFAAGAANSNNHGGGFNGDGRVEPAAAAANTIPAVTITPVATTPAPPLVVDSSSAAAAGGVSSSNVIAAAEDVGKKVDKEPEERL